MNEIARHGFDPQQYLCGGLELVWKEEAYKNRNPFWVVQTTADIMKDHTDIFNDNMIAFVRQPALTQQSPLARQTNVETWQRRFLWASKVGLICPPRLT